MSKSLLAAFPLSLLLAAQLPAAAQEAEAPARLQMTGGRGAFPQGSCAGQVWPREALRYEIEGTVTIRYRVASDGRVADPQIARSSGWALLDNASIQAVRSCTYTPEQAAANRDRVLPLQFVWVLEGDRIHPNLLSGSCVPSGPIDGFQPYDRRPTDAAGIKVRFLVDGNGQAHAIKLEGSPDAALAAQVVQHLETCRFAYDPDVVGTRTDTMSGRVLLR